MRSSLICIAALALTALGACDGTATPDDAPPTAFSVTDSAGVRISTNTLPPPDRGAAVGDPEVQIGTVGGDAPYQLFGVSGALRAADGRFVVANSGTAEIHVYAPDGSHDFSFGRRGDGPAEFRAPHLRLLRGDTIVVEDGLDLVLFDLEGTFLDRHSLDLGLMSRLIRSPFEGGGWQTLDTYVVPSTIWDNSARPEGAFRVPTTFFAVDVEAERVDTVTTVGGIEQQFIEVGGRLSPFILPFGDRYLHRSAAGYYLISDSERPEYHLRTPEGRHRIVRWDVEPEPVTDDDLAEWKRRALDGRSPDRARELERAWGSMEFPEHKPVFEGVALTSDGSGWVLRAPGDGEVWWTRFDRDGEHAGDVRFPARFRLTDAGPDWALGVYRDDLDVEYLQLYRLPPR